MKRYFDIVIVGGGPAGSVAAIVLAKAGRDVLLIDGSVSEVVGIGESIPPAACTILRDLGLLERFLNDKHMPCYGNLYAWGSHELRSINYIFDPNGHGWHLDRTRFDTSLRSSAHQSGCCVRTGVRLVKSERVCEAWRILLTTVNDQVGIGCRWIVDATGRRSFVASRHGAIRVNDDMLVAVFSSFRSINGDRDTRTMIEAVPNGWWYTALVPSGERILVFLTDADLVHRSNLFPEGFVKSLEETNYISSIIKTYSYVIKDHIHVTRAGSGHLNQFGGKGWIAVGDAAMSFDPLSSQGILNAIYTGMKAGQAVDAQFSNGVGAVSEYDTQLSKIFLIYQQNLMSYYAYENRWIDHLFWRRRMKRKETN